MIAKLQLSESEHERLIAHAKAMGITFLSAPFDMGSLYLLTDRFGLRTIKIPSGEITNFRLLLAAARKAEKLIVSTGMCTLEEVEAGLGVIAYGFTAARDASPKTSDFARAYASEAGRRSLHGRVTLLQCTTEYPTPAADVNLAAMRTMADAFGLPVGLSDHTEGIHIPAAAVAMGATMIEKHFTLDRGMPGPDHKASLEPDELREMVRICRETACAIGDGLKRPADSEMKNLAIARKSLVAATKITKGERFTEENLTCKRPGTGISAARWYDVIGNAAAGDFEADDLINL
jgi:N-acetylneuraminate synthase